MTDRIQPEFSPSPLVPVGLGLAGLIPFVALSAALFVPSDFGGPGARVIHMALVTYGALIASFLGGVRWGVALMKGDRQTAHYLVSVLPSLVAWLTLATPRPYDLMMLIGIFLALGISDIGLVLKGGMPVWFGRLRTALTAVVVTSLLAALFAPG